MSPSRASICLGLYLLVGCGRVAAQSCFGTNASLWNVFAAGDLNSYSSSCEGRMAALGTLSLSQYGSGGQIPSGLCSSGTTNPATWAVVAGTKVTGTQSSFNNGHITAPSITLSSVSVTSGCSNNNILSTTAFLTGVRDTISRISSSIYQLTTTGTATLSNTNLILTFTDSTRSLQVVSISASTLQTMTTIELRSFSFSTSFLIINVDGTSPSMSGMDLSSLNAQKVIWNLGKATSLTISSGSIRGSILAINAAGNMNGGNVLGQIFVKSFQGTTSLSSVFCNGVNFDPSPSASPSNSVSPSASPSLSPSPTSSPSLTPSSLPPGSSPYPSSTPSASISRSPSALPSLVSNASPSATLLIQVSPSPSPLADPSFLPCFSLGVDFNVLTINKFISNTYVSGRLITGTSADLTTSFSIGSDLGLNKCSGGGLDPPNQSILLSGGQINWPNGSLSNGNIVGSNPSGIGSPILNTLSANNCQFIQSSTISSLVTAAQKLLRIASTYFGRLAPTTSNVSLDASGVLTVTFLNSSSPLQVVRLNSTTVLSFVRMNLVNYNSVNSFLLINIEGTSGIRIENKILAAQLSAGRTLWNLFQHSGTLVIDKTEFRGSLLAVDSDLAPATNAILIGQTILRSSGVSTDGTISKAQFGSTTCLGLPLDMNIVDADGSFDQAKTRFIAGITNGVGTIIGNTSGASDSGMSTSTLIGIGVGSGGAVLIAVALGVYFRIRIVRARLTQVFKPET